MKRDLSFDALRGLAIICVIYIHASGLGYIEEVSNFNSKATVVLRQLSNFAVPLFLFISGYFMAKKEFATSKEYFSWLFNQLPRVLIPLLVWSFIYSIQRYIEGENSKSIILKIFTFRSSFHFYFILAICQYYILLPLIKKYLVTKNGLIISFLISAISCLTIEYLRYVENLNMPLIIYGGAFTTWLVFPVMGMYFSLKGVTISKMTTYIFCVLGLIVSIGASFFLSNKYNDISNAVSAVKLSSFIFSCFLITAVFLNKNYLNSRVWLIKIGELSFGIYFFHMLLLSPLKIYAQSIFSASAYSSVVTQVALTILVLIISTLLGLSTRALNKNISIKYLGY